MFEGTNFGEVNVRLSSNYWLILPIALLVTFGQLLVKWRSAAGSPFADGGAVQNFMRFVADPVNLAAYAAGFLANLGWLYVVTKLPLTVAFPVYMGTTFTFVLVGGWLVLGEPMTLVKITAVHLILGGMILAMYADG
jgi:multidrug transporter EmrE-like cation transporter